MANSGAPRWAKEIIVISLWGAAAVNVTIYTWETALEMYKKPPLSAWKMQPVEGGEGSGGGSGGGFLGGLGESLSKAFNKVGEAIQPGHNAPNPLTLAPRGTFKQGGGIKVTRKLEKEVLALNRAFRAMGFKLTEKTIREMAEGKLSARELYLYYTKNMTLMGSDGKGLDKQLLKGAVNLGVLAAGEELGAVPRGTVKRIEQEQSRGGRG